MDEGEELTLPASAFDHIIERPRLISALEEAAARVILFCAPAGFGKTTLARQWSDRQRRTPVWHRTTRASGDVAALAVSLDNLFAGVGAPNDRDPNRIAMIAAANPRPEPLARALVSTYKRLPKSLLLVIDEYEAADTAEADQLFGALVDGLPIRFLVTSRSRPTWFEPRLTVYGEAVELGVDDLTMTDEEAEAVLELGRRGKADRAVVEQAQGWPAVLGLAAMRSEKDLPQALLPRALYDFLASELLESAPAEVREGLVVLAAASVASTEVARLLLGPRSKEILRQAAGLRLVALGLDGGVALHPLLRELMLLELKADLDRREGVSNRLRPLIDAARWDEAIAAAEAVRTLIYVTDLVQAAADRLLRAGRLESLRRCVSIARAVGVEPPFVDYLESELAYTNGDFDRALLLGARAAPRLGAHLVARAHLCAARAAFLGGRRKEALEHAEAAEALAVDDRTRIESVWARLTQTLDDELPESATMFEEFKAVASNSNEDALRIATARLFVAATDGGTEQALEDASIMLSALGDAEPLVECAFLSAYSDHLSIKSRYENALETIKLATMLADASGFEFVRRYLLFHKAKVLIGLRKVAVAEQTLKALERSLLATPDVYCEAHDAVLRASLYITVGDAERALAALSREPNARVSPGPRGERLGLRAIIFAATGHPEQALESAAGARHASRALEAQTLALTSEATVAYRAGHLDTAAERLQKARATGGLHQLVLAVRAFPSLADLMANDATMATFVSDLLLSSNDTAIARMAGLTVPRSAPRRREPLSPREREIHELLAQGLTNREIAKLLFISHSTAKVHVHHVLEKLGVRSRVEAARLWQPQDS
jgi:LuxR family maltose regulon positive regulatory protein